MLILLLAGAYRGFQKGLLRTVVGLLALVLGFTAALEWMEAGTTFLAETFGTNSDFLPILSFILIFIVIVVGITLIGSLLKLVIDLTPLGILDGLSGALLGLLKWALGISLLLWMLEAVGIGLPEEENSQLYGQVSQVAPYVLDQLKEWYPAFRQLIEQVVSFFKGLTE